MVTVVGCIKPLYGTFLGVDRVGHSLTHSLTVLTRSLTHLLTRSRTQCAHSTHSLTHSPTGVMRRVE